MLNFFFLDLYEYFRQDMCNNNNNNNNVNLRFFVFFWKWGLFHSIYLFSFLSIYLFIYLIIYLFIYLFYNSWERSSFSNFAVNPSGNDEKPGGEVDH